MTAAERYLLARFPDGGVVVDLETGNYFRVDVAAAEACEALATVADRASAAAQVARRLDLPLELAERVLADTRDALSAAPARATPQGTYRFLPESGGYGLWHDHRRVLAVDGERLEVRLPDETAERAAHEAALARLDLYVRALAPKLLFLRGHTVLHASGCAANGRVLAFAGISRAGKTTTARAFAAAGARLLAEDLLLLEATPRGPTVALAGEAEVGRWCAEASAALRASGGPVSSEALETVGRGTREPLAAVLFLDAARRAGHELAVRALAAPDGLIALMESDFLGDATPAASRRFFASATATAAGTTLLEATPPFGAERLPEAARRYMSSWTS